VPNADRDKETSIPINQATFLMSNMIAQAPDNNQGPWADMENDLRTLLPANELYIVAGGVGTGGSGFNGGITTTLANGHVTVPAQTWKVALVLSKGNGDDVSRATCTTRTIAVLMPNTQGIRTVDWQTYLTTVDEVERQTGYNLFSELPAAVQRCVEAGINGNNTKNVPVFSAIAPATIEVGSQTVTISGVLGVDGVFPSGQVTISLGSQAISAFIGANGAFSATLDAAGLALGGGPYPVSFTYAGDANFTSASATSTLTVIDTSAPLIEGVTATPGELRVPNHKMIDVTLSYLATDVGSAASCSLSVTSTESANGLGDGNTSIDWRVIDPTHVQLRAERSGLGNGRQYFVTVTCTDAAGNASSATTTVSVPK